MNIVSLLPSATEIVYALGLEDDLSGVTAECDHPPAARAKPVVSTTSLPEAGGATQGEIDAAVRATVGAGDALYSVDEDALRAMQPDLILAQDLCRVCAVPSGQVTDALAKIGCRSQVISLDPSGLEDIFSGIEEVGDAAGRPERARSLTDGLRARVEAVRRAAADLEPVAALALEWLDPPFCGGHWVPEMIEIAGGRDVLNVSGKPSRAVGWAEIAEAQPEVVVYMPCGYHLGDAVAQADALWSVPEFAATPAARSGRVVAVDASAYFSRPGPRIVDGLEILTWCLHREAFPEPPGGRAGALAP